MSSEAGLAAMGVQGMSIDHILSSASSKERL